MVAGRAGRDTSHFVGIIQIMWSTVIATGQRSEIARTRLPGPQKRPATGRPGRIRHNMPVFVDGNSLSTVIACQERHTLQSTFVRPHERKNRRSRIRCSGDFSGVVNSICGTVVSARENAQVLRLRVVGMTPERGSRCSFTTAGLASNDISQIVQFGWDLSRVFAGKIRDDIFSSLAECDAGWTKYGC